MAMKGWLQGVIEGFYGPVWRPEARKELLRWMGEKGYNAYIYAPKGDPYHRERWREPYPAEKLQEFQDLFRVGGEAKVEVMMSLSPGLSLTYSDPTELEALWRKVSPFIDMGLKRLGLFFDDIPFELRHEADKKRYAGLAEAQADFALRLLEKGKGEGLHLILCPTYYAGEPDHPYLIELGRRLPEEVDLFWTGPAICSPAISEEHLQQVEKAMGRAPLIWDNYPVNDVYMEPELHIGPYRGRDSSLLTGTRGVFLNPMSLPLASRIPLGTAARFFSDPDGYDPEKCWEEAVKEELRGRDFGDDLIAAFKEFSEAVTISPLVPEEPPLYVSFVKEFQSLLNVGRREEAIALYMERVTAMKRAYEVLREKGKEIPLLQEISLWITDYGRWSGALEKGLELLLAFARMESLTGGKAREEGRKIALEAWERVKILLEEAVSWPTVTCGDTLRVFLQRILRGMKGLSETLR